MSTGERIPVPPSALEGFTRNRNLLLEDLYQQVKKALLLLDDTIVQEYRQAVARVPHLVTRESPVEVFLRAENYHVLLTAKRLALYWKTRKECFGTERWLLPLMARPQGGAALLPEHIHILQTGAHILLTQMEPPQQRAAAFVLNMSRLPLGVDVFQPQIIFYLVSTVGVACPALQNPGMTIVHVVQDGWRPFVMPQAERLKMLSESLPVRIRQVVVAQACAPPVGTEHLLAYRLYEQHRVCDHNMQLLPEAHQSPVDCLTASTTQDMLKLLQAKGLCAAILPDSLGGTFSYDRDLGPWLMSRAALEQLTWEQDVAMLTTAGAAAAAAAAGGGGASAASTSTHVMAAASPTTVGVTGYGPNQQLGFMTSGTTPATSVVATASSEHLLVRQALGESDEDFTRRRNAVYARRFATKQKWARLELQVQHDTLQTTHQQLQAENVRLTNLLQQAYALVAILQSTTGSSGGGSGGLGGEYTTIHRDF
jgi:hypothetical protein